MNTRVLKLADGSTEMEVYINTQDKIALSLDISTEFPAVIELDQDDAIELVKELKRLLKLM